jgi:hypothetical protein
MRWLSLMFRILCAVDVFYGVGAAAYLGFLKVVCGHVAADGSLVHDMDSLARQIAITDEACIGGWVQTKLEWLRLLVPLSLGVLAAAGLFVTLTMKKWPQIEKRLW